jgi:hypothetical protein
MHESEDYLFRPVFRGMISAEKIFDGSVTLYQIALMNEAIDVFDENQFRLSKGKP